MKGVKTRNGGQWTAARFRSFIVSLLRAGTMRWGPKHAAIKRAFVQNGPNPATGRPCKLHRCEDCKGLFAQGDMKADHIEPVIDPRVGFVDWNTYIDRMFLEADGYAARCETCHAKKTAEENELRRQIKKTNAIQSSDPDQD